MDIGCWREYLFAEQKGDDDLWQISQYLLFKKSNIKYHFKDYVDILLGRREAEAVELVIKWRQRNEEEIEFFDAIEGTWILQHD